MTTKDLYEQDYPAWLEETAKQLRQMIWFWFSQLEKLKIELLTI